MTNSANRGQNYDVHEHPAELMPRVGVHRAAITTAGRDGGGLRPTASRRPGLRLPGGGGSQILPPGRRPAKFGRINNVVTSVDNFGQESKVYDGVDLTSTCGCQTAFSLPVAPARSGPGQLLYLASDPRSAGCGVTGANGGTMSLGTSRTTHVLRHPAAVPHA